MNDYQTKRRYWQQKLERNGYYQLRRQRIRARRQAKQAHKADGKLQQHGGHAPGPDGVSYSMLSRREAGQIMRQLSREVFKGDYEPSTRYGDFVGWRVFEPSPPRRIDVSNHL